MLINSSSKRDIFQKISPPVQFPEAELAVASKAEDRFEKAKEKPQKSSWLRKVGKFGLTALQLSGTIGGIGVGAAVATNYDVVEEAITQDSIVYGYAKEVNAQEKTVAKEQVFVDVTGSKELNRLQDHIQVKKDSRSLTATLESSKAQGVIHKALQGEGVQKALGKELNKLEGKINTILANVNLKPGEALFEANIPFPKGEGSLVQLLGEDIPVGIRELELTEVPLVLKYDFDTFDTGLDVDLAAIEVDKAPLPDGVNQGLHLLSASAKASNQDLHETEFSGKIRLEFDDGAATRRALEKETNPEKIALLEARLQRVEEIKKLGSEQKLEGLLDFALGQREMNFRGNLGGDGQGMGDAKVHAWLTPDSDGDGRAEVKLSAEIHTPGLQVVEFHPESMEHAPTRETGIKKKLQDKISNKIEEKACELAPKILDGLRPTIEKEVRKTLAKELSNGELELDALLDGTLEVVNQSTQGVGIELTKINVDQRGNLVGAVESEGSLKETLGPKATVRKQIENAVEVVRPDYAPMVQIKNPDDKVLHVQSDSPSIVIPGPQARRFLNAVLKNPDTQKAFEKLTLKPKQAIQDKAKALPGLSGSLFVDVELPFPSAENLQSPLGPIPALSHKTIPLEANYKVNEFGLDFQLDARLLEVEEAARPKAAEKDGVFVGALAISTSPLSTTLEGSLQVNKGETEGGAEWAETAVDEAFQGQDFDFQTEVSLGQTEAVFYLWLTPDQNGDGRADIAIAHRTLKTGSDGAQVEVKKVSTPDRDLELSSRLGGRLNGIVNRIVATEILQSGETLTEEVSKLLESKVDVLLGQGSEEVSAAVNEKIPGFYKKLEDVKVKLPEALRLKGELDLGLREVEVAGDSLIVNYGEKGLKDLLVGTAKPTIAQQKAEEGELLLNFSGSLFNRLVNDKRAGGPLDWDPLLEDAIGKNGLIKSLKLATDREGNVLSPQLKVVDGEAVLSLTVDAQTSGLASPVTMGARKLPGFLGKGLGWATENTVGAVLGSRLRVEVQVPVEFGIQDGTLSVQAGEARFVKAAKKGKRKLGDYIPTRALSGVVTKGLAKAFGPKAINKLLAEVNPTVDPSAYGLEWNRVEVATDPNGIPVITVGVKAGDKLPELLLNSN